MFGLFLISVYHTSSSLGNLNILYTIMHLPNHYKAYPKILVFTACITSLEGGPTAQSILMHLTLLVSV